MVILPRKWTSSTWTPVNATGTEPQSKKRFGSPEKSFYDIQPTSERYEVPGIFPTRKPLEPGFLSMGNDK